MVDKKQLSADFKEVCGFEQARGNWSEEEVAEFDAAVRADLAEGNDERLQCWAAWFAEQAEWIRRFRAMCRASEQRIKDAARQRRTHAAA